MPVARVVLSLCLAACCTASATHVPGVGGRQLDRFSPIVRAINDQPVPEDLEGVRVAAFLLDLAHDPGARELHLYAERQALLDLLGEARPPRPAKVELAVSSMHGEEKNVAALRTRLLEAPVRAEVLREHDVSLERSLHGEGFRHEAASMWVQDHGGRWRRLGVRVHNVIARPILKGKFSITFGSARDAREFTCSYRDLAVGASAVVGCSGDGSRSAESVLRAIRGEGEIALRHGELAFALPGGRLEVGSMTRFVDDDNFVERRALATIDRASCRERGTCGSQARQQVAGDPMLGGVLLGLVAGGIYALVVLVRGRRSAARAAFAMYVVLFVVLTAAVIAGIASLSHGPGLLVALVAGLAVGQVGDAMVGFSLALGSTIGAIELARVRRSAA